MTKQERIQLNSLSKLLYKSSSKWNTLVNKGKVSDMEEILEDGTVRKYRSIKYPTVEEVKVEMQKLWQEELDRQEMVNAAKGLSDLEIEARKKEQEKTIMQEYEENPKLDVFSDQVQKLSNLKKEALAQKEMIKEKTGI